MIFSEVNFLSATLDMRVTMDVLLPQRAFSSTNNSQKPAYRVLYLLHGYSDDHTSWQRWTSIERYVEGMNLAVVMPNVHLSFYADMARGNNYWQFISEEVPAVVRDQFQVSSARADTFAAGLSMGGYGALKLALTYPERFSAAASLSGSTDICRLLARDYNDRENRQYVANLHNVFGEDLNAVAGSEHDLFALAEKVSKRDVQPRLYQCCGDKDFLYNDNLHFRDHARQLSLNLTYEDGPGEHNWAYWDKMIQHVLAWLDE